MVLNDWHDEIREDAWHNQVENEIKQERMEIGHTDKTKNGDDDAPELNFVILGYATEELIGDLAIKDNDQAAYY